MKAPEILAKAAEIMQQRAASRDKDGERSMAHAVRMFNAYDGGEVLNTVDGWMFMAFLKMARGQAGTYTQDDWDDLVAYTALAAEEASPEDDYVT